MINHDQLVQELAAQFYINKDRTTVGWGISDPNLGKYDLKDYPDLNRQWYDYKDEWELLTVAERQVWLDKAEEWLYIWREKYEDLYPLLLTHGKRVFGKV